MALGLVRGSFGRGLTYHVVMMNRRRMASKMKLSSMMIF
jgi:hypothetical protein